MTTGFGYRPLHAAENSNFALRIWSVDQGLPDSSVTAVTQTPDGYLWIGTKNGLARFDGVRFVASGAESFDRVILATGFRPDLRPLLPNAEGVLDGQGQPLVTGRPTAEPGLYFCGQIASPTGQLREIGLEAQRIAAAAREFIVSRASRDV